MDKIRLVYQLAAGLFAGSALMAVLSTLAFAVEGNPIMVVVMTLTCIANIIGASWAWRRARQSQ